MSNISSINRLQFRHHNNVFDTREQAIAYIMATADGSIKDAQEGLASQVEEMKFSLFAEPTVLTYKNEDDDKNPHVIIAIGSRTNNSGQYYENRFCVIDIDKIKDDIEAVKELIEEAVKALTIIPKASNTLELHSEKTDDGTILSGNVILSESEIFDNVRKENTIIETNNGLFTFVDMSYDAASDKMTFQVNGNVKDFELDNDYVISGNYSREDESIHLQMKKGGEIVFPLEDLIDEWTVLGDASNTPIVLTKETYGYGSDDEHYHVEPWQDILKADVRVLPKSSLPNNILEKTADGRYLFVDGKASNVTYYVNGEKSNVQDALDDLMKIGLSSDGNNIIFEKSDGYFASAKLTYDNTKNALYFTTSNVTGGTSRNEILLNTVKIFDEVYYDSVNEKLVLVYTDGTGQHKSVKIPVGQLIEEWEPNNEAHNVKIVRARSIGGKDKVSADAKIHQGDDNILEDVGHELLVRGVSSNIKHGTNSTVEQEIISLHYTDDVQETHLTKIDDTIGSGFTNDPHENITYKFEQEVARAQSEEARIEGKLDDEIDRATSEDARIEGKLDDEIARATDAETALDEKIDQVNKDRYISVGSTDSVIMTMTPNQASGNNITSDVRVSNKSNNIISIDGTEKGIFASIDLTYDSNADTLTLSRNGQEDKVIQLVNESDIISIYYDAHTEELVIVYRIDTQEIKEVRVPLGDLIHEVDVDSGHTSGAIQLGMIHSHSEGTPEPDKIIADVILSNDVTNILENKQGHLYVSNSSITANANAIANEIARATSAETALGNRTTALENNLADEVTRAKNAESALTTSLNNEVVRATSAETALANSISSLDHKVDDEIARATSAESSLNSRTTALESGLSSEIARAKNAESAITNNLNNEVVRATSAETALANSLSAETTARVNKDNDLESRLSDIEGGVNNLNVSDTESLHLSLDSTTYELTGDVKIANAPQNIISKVNIYDGLFASVDLTYSATTNQLFLTTSDLNGNLVTRQAINLVGGALLDGLEYDSVSRNLIIKYHTTDEPSVTKTLNVDLTGLIEEWDVDNTNHTVNLFKSYDTTTGLDKLSADVKVSNAQHNILEVVSDNLLYVEGLASNIIYTSTTTVKDELDSINSDIAELSSSTSSISGDVRALSAKVDTAISSGAGLNADGTYHNNRGCVISAATSLNDADVLLDTAVCELKEEIETLISDSDTYSTKLYVEETQGGKNVKVDVRVSHGNANEMTDSDLVITDLNGALVESGVGEFTDTNVLREVNISGELPSSPYNGIYLSNVWNCGEYISSGTTSETDFTPYYWDPDAGPVDYSNNNRL